MKSSNLSEQKAAFFTLSGGLVLVYWRFFIGYAPSGHDLVYHYLPYQHLVKQAIWSGHWPYWNPMTFCGRPLMADIQVGFFYPPNWLHWFLPLPISFTLLFLAHSAWTLWGCYRLGGAWELKSPASCLMAVLFTFSGFLTVKLLPGMVLFHYVAAWLPWSALAMTALMRKPSARRVASLAVCLAMSVLAGAPQIAFYSWIMIAGLSVVLAFQPQSTQRAQNDDGESTRFGFSPWKKFVSIGAAFLLAILLTAVQTVQTYQMAALSFDRGANLRPDKKWEAMTEGSLNPKLLALMLNPDIFGPGNDDLRYKGSDMGFAEAFAYLPWFTWAFLVPVGMVLMLMWGRDTRGTANMFYCAFAFALFSLLMAGGKYSAVYEFFFRHIPGFDLFRVPARWLLGFTAGVSVCAGIAFDRWLVLAGRIEKRRGVISLLLFFPLLLCCAVLFLGQVLNLPFLALFNSASAYMIIFLELFALMMIAISHPLVARTFVPQMGGAAHYGLSLLASVELALLAWPSQTTTPIAEFEKRHYPRTLLTKTLRETTKGRVLWTDGLLDWHNDQNTPEVLTNGLVMQGLADARGYDPINARWIGTWFNRLAGLPPEMNPRGSMYVPRIIHPSWLTLMGVEKVLSYDDLSSLPGIQLQGAIKFPEGPLGIWKNANYRGLAFAVPLSSDSVSLAPEAREAGQKMAESRTQLYPNQIERQIVVDSNAGATVEAMDSIGSPARANDSLYEVKPVEEGPNRFVYRTAFPKAAVLYFAQSAYPGWNAKIDGDYVPVSVACGTFLAARVPAGDKIVEFEYRPPAGFEAARIVSLAAALAILFIFLRPYLSGRPSVPDPTA
ncbi:hypothetical protein HY256_09170 [Candidatus Sumerlaeota bacterium]|nr:hypothetical protein [Candidatus Sumerlaeota bacterium]